MSWSSVLQDFKAQERLGMEFVCIAHASVYHIITSHGLGISYLLFVAYISTYLYMELLYWSLELFFTLIASMDGWIVIQNIYLGTRKVSCDITIYIFVQWV